jgi:hypothetical protein
VCAQLISYLETINPALADVQAGVRFHAAPCIPVNVGCSLLSPYVLMALQAIMAGLLSMYIYGCHAFRCPGGTDTDGTGITSCLNGLTSKRGAATAAACGENEKHTQCSLQQQGKTATAEPTKAALTL